MCDVLVAAGWITGEYSILDDNSATHMIAFLLSPRVLNLPASVQSCYLFAFFKIFIRSTLANEFTTELDAFAQSLHLEVQERVSNSN
jgi:hypothetical protein